MNPEQHPWLAPWDDFYLTVGSAAAALIGLQFVAISLIAEQRRRSPEANTAFGSPTIVHFSAVLLLTGILSAPWTSLAGPRVLLTASGIAGFAYVMVVIRRARRQEDYEPVLEDWLTHALLPAVAYAAIAIAAGGFLRRSTAALFVVGAMSLVLLFVGIHNSWDSVTYIAVERDAPPDDDVNERGTPSPVARDTTTTPREQT